MKPIINQFRAAHRLANEWRDTLFYGGLAIAATEAAMIGNIEHLNTIGFTAANRELLRSVSWMKDGVTGQHQYAGFSQKPINWGRNSISAGIMMLSIFCVNDNLLKYDPSLFNRVYQLPFILYAAFMLKNRVDGRVREIPKYYFDPQIGMWDWPRKNGGGGTTQTQKLVDGFKQIGRNLAGLIPKPPRPAYATSKALNLVLSKAF
jgi:hypothetical protein